jgi:hypothetical protein
MSKEESKENIELAREHLKLAKDLIVDESKKHSDDKSTKEFGEAAFALEKAESEVEDIEELD